MILRENLMNARKKEGFTQLQIAQALGISLRHYNSLEAGTSEGSVRVWKRLKKLLNRSIDYLLEQVVDSGQEK